MDTAEVQISTFAFFTRLTVIALQFLSNIALPDHDADVFHPPSDPEEVSHFNWADWTVHVTLGGFRRWDAVYFTHIMQYGYTYENCVAFFPSYPLVVSTLSSVVAQIGILQQSSWILLFSVLFNVLLFVLTGQEIYRLGKIVTGNRQMAFYAAVLFCVNPASIFMTAPYSEITYTYLLVKALLKLNQGHKLTASLILGLSVFTRSNGLVGAGFLLHAVAHSFSSSLLRLYTSQKTCIFQFCKLTFCLLMKTVRDTLLYLLLIIMPFFIYQYYVYMEFCKQSGVNKTIPSHLVSYGRLRGYHILGDPLSAWCTDAIPLSYTYIQKHHWAVGFLSYYEIKQVPNFLLALPVIILSIRSCCYFFKLNPQLFYTLGLVDRCKGSISQVANKKQDDDAETYSNSEEMTEGDCGKPSNQIHRQRRQTVQSDKLVVYVFHLASLIIFGCFFMHIQVLTRMIFSSSPLIYWYCAILLTDTPTSSGSPKGPSQPATWKGKDSMLQYCLSWLLKSRLQIIFDAFPHWSSLGLQCRLVLLYFITYFVLGTVMFANFLPWT